MGEGSGPAKQLPAGAQLVDRYLIQDVIGLGGMGSVYRARDLHFPNVVKLVAVKEMINNARDPLVRKTIIQNFEREANILVTLNHPAIPKIFDYFSYDERSYLVLEYVNGRDLEAILAEEDGPLPEDQVIAWAIEILDVLEYLHNHKPEPIIFRDLKPSNIMINQTGRVVLVDFGIAKMFRTGQKGTMIGTEGYSPPEQYRGEATRKADIYSLGATIHHLLTRRDPRVEPPFSFGERPIRRINPTVSPELEIVIMKALSYDPEDRYETAELMKTALLSVAKKTGALSRINMTSPASEQTVKPLWVFRCEDEVRGSPNLDSNFLYIGSYDNNLYAINASTGEFQWKFPSRGGIVTKPALGQDIVFVGSEDCNLYALGSRNGKPIWNIQVDGPIRSSPKVGEGHVFFGADDGFVYAVNILTGRRTFRYDSGSPIRSSPSLTTEMLYFGNEGGDFISLDFRGQNKWRFHAKKAITSSAFVAQGICYFSSLDSTFYAVDAKSGWVIWRYRMLKGSVSSPIRVDTYAIVGSADGNIYCVDANNAREIWKFQTDHQVSGSPAVYKDSVYCGTADGLFYSLELKTGRLRWKFATDGPITSAPIVYNDIVYIGSGDHIVYALIA